MAVVSMLVFIEECIYIYRKVPANKKSVIIWVNGAAPVRMTSEKLWRVRRKMKICYLHIFVHIQGKMHRFWSDVLYLYIPSFSCVFQVIGTMSCLGMWIPRATMFTDMTSAWWVSLSLPLFFYSPFIARCAVCFGTHRAPPLKKTTEGET